MTINLHNLAAKFHGSIPADSYQYNIGPADRVRVVVPDESRDTIRAIVGKVASVMDHGWYQVVVIRTDEGVEHKVRVYRDGPREDDGAQECRILERRWSPPVRHRDRI